jgi:hypothetical protein
VRFQRNHLLELPTSAHLGKLREPWRSEEPETLQVAQMTLALGGRAGASRFRF